MKGIYFGIKEQFVRLCGLLTAVTVVPGALAVFMNDIFSRLGIDWFQRFADFFWKISGPLFGIVFLLVILVEFTPCGFRADETGFTISELGIFRKRYLYDDIADVILSSHDRLESNRKKPYNVTIIDLTITDRSGNKRAYAQRCLTRPETISAGQDESRLPKLMKLYNYIQSQMGWPAFKEQYTPVQPARPLVIMTGRSADAAEIGEESNESRIRI